MLVAQETLKFDMIVIVPVLVCYMLCPSQLTAQPGGLEMWKIALQDGYCIQLFRDEILMVHKEFSNTFDSMKGHSKRKKDIEESLAQAMANRFVDRQ